jgi:perosamine synthetase
MTRSDLAIFGGTPVIAAGEIKPWPHVTDVDRAAVASVLADGRINEQRGVQSRLLAEEFAAYCGVDHGIATNSGTAALHMSVAALGVEPGDEVLVPAFTFWASAAAVLHHNAIPVFVDIDPRTFCIDPARIEEKITERTRAIMPVHIHGLCADMEPITAIARRRGLAVIEDAAQAHGAEYRGQRAGALGDVAGFSLQMSKVLTTGSEGGLFVTNDPALYENAALLQYFGEQVETGHERAAQQYDAAGIGWMYRGDVFGQAFARSQLGRLDELNAARIANCEHLAGLLEDIPGVHAPHVPSDRLHVFYNFAIRLEPSELGLDLSPRAFRERVQAALIAEGVPAGQWQRVPVPAQAVFQRRAGYGRGCPWHCWENTMSYDPQDYPRAWEFLDAHTYLFDTHHPNTSVLMDRYAEAVAKVLRHAHLLEAADPEAERRVEEQRDAMAIAQNRIARS